MLRFTTLGFALLAVAAPAAPPAIEPGDTVTFEGTWDNPTDFSAAVQVGNVILVGSDEISRLQTGTLAGNRVTRGADVFEKKLKKKKDPKDKDEEIELDIEALAANVDATDPNKATVYALGSHSVARANSGDEKRDAPKNRQRLESKPEAHPERDVLFRFTYDASTGKAGKPDQASLRAALANTMLAPYASLPGKENGVDLEGLAVDGTTLFAGFRGPVFRHGFVPVLQFTFEAPENGKLLYVPLDGRGIRDMVKVRDGFLLLAGPVGDADAPHRVYLWNGKDCFPGKDGFGGRLLFLGDVPATGGGKAEALLLTADETAQGYEALVLFDSVEKGGATRMRIGKTAVGATASTKLCGKQPS
jgi:hypothetical protein